jgi:peptidoglycan/LPS O-acetylase OafA/YrhL
MFSEESDYSSAAHMEDSIDGRDGVTAVVPIPDQRPHIELLDAIRGIAVILVLAVHFQIVAVLPQTSALSHWIAAVMSWGWCGVDLFFVLSGFLITGILLDTKKAEKRFQCFYSRRILRIFPLYYAVVLLCIAAAILLRHSPSNENLGPSPVGWVMYLLYLQNLWIPFGDLHRMGFLGPFWSLAIEEQFYLIWPLFVWRLSTKYLVKLCSLGILGALLLRAWSMPHATTALAYVVYMNTLTRMDALLTGGLCAIVVRNAVLLGHVRKFISTAVAAVVSGLALFILGGHNAWNDYDVLVYCHLLLVLGFGCLVLSAYLMDGNSSLLDRSIRSTGLSAFGRYSYGIYVYQGFVIELTLHLFRHHGWWGHSTRYALAVALGWMTVPFLLAFLSYHLYEKKFLQLRRPFAVSKHIELVRGSGELAAAAELSPMRSNRRTEQN